VRRDAFHSLHDRVESNVFVPGENDMHMVRHHDETMKPTSGLVFAGATRHHDIAFSFDEDSSISRAKRQVVRFAGLHQMREIATIGVRIIADGHAASVPRRGGKSKDFYGVNRTRRRGRRRPTENRPHVNE
jgi:hypothetical protein